MKRVTSAKTDRSGELTAQRAGIYCLVFDNTTSRFVEWNRLSGAFHVYPLYLDSSSSRKVSYRVEVIKAHDG